MSRPNGVSNEACPQKYLQKGSNIARASDGTQLALEGPVASDSESKVSSKLQAAKDFDASHNGSDPTPVVKDENDQWAVVNSEDALGKGEPVTPSSEAGEPSELL